jgi:hypothetical protein
MRYLAGMMVVAAGLGVGVVFGDAAKTPAKTAPAATQADADTEWEKNGNYAMKMEISDGLTKGGKIPVTLSIKNVSAKKIGERSMQVWLLVAQGPRQVFFTAPHKAASKGLAPGEQLQIVIDDAGSLDTYRYTSDLTLPDGMPVPAEGKPAPKREGKLADVMPMGLIKIRTFVVVKSVVERDSKEMQTMQVLSSATASAKVDPDEPKPPASAPAAVPTTKPAAPGKNSAK